MELLKYNINSCATAFSTKRGGDGSAYASFNITHYCGDNKEHVAACRKELCNALGIDNSRLILPRQTHGCEILCIGKEFVSLSAEEQEKALHGIDAVITSLPRTCIGVSTADCVPLLLCDGRQKVVAAVHAGWRGTVARIAEKGIAKMIDAYGCNAADIKAVIAPSIGPDAFEVGDEVYAEFEKAGFAMENIAKRHEKWHIDLWEANRQQLTMAGVKESNIEVAGICTHTNHKEFFSARRLGINSGRIFNGIMIK